MTLDAKKRSKADRELREAVQHVRAEYKALSLEYSRAMDTVGGVALVRSLDRHRALHSAIEELQQRAA